ncbi:MAG: GNAT family N-acetyltransferase, partial [Gemmatimonadaceae bacterium]
MTEDPRYVEDGAMTIAPVTLVGKRVRLVPMSRDHMDALLKAASFPAIWEHTGTSALTSVDALQRYMDTALLDRDEGRGIPFVTTDAATGEIIGSTRFANFSLHDRRVEIGWTWMRPDRQHTGINGEAKSLMLQHAFD